MSNPYADWGNQQSQKLAAAQHKAPTLNDQQMGGVAPGSVPMGKPAPNFYFKPQTQTPGKTSFALVGGKPPVHNNIRLPQNTNGNGLSVYGDGKGNMWFEDDKTGQRYPITKNPAAGGDTLVRPPQVFNRFMQLPIQHLNAALKARVTPIKA